MYVNTNPFTALRSCYTTPEEEVAAKATDPHASIIHAIVNS
jgi:hypothetical protein